MMQKINFRKKQKAALIDYAKLPIKATEDQQLFKQLISLPIIKKSKSIGVTASLPFEVDTSKIIAYFWEEGKQVFLAKSNFNRHELNFVAYNYESKLSKNKFGVEEVADSNAKIENQLDLFLVPGIAFARDTHARLGFGGGFYDRFLAKNKTANTISLANSKMLYQTAQWPMEKFDIAIQTIVTPAGIIR